MRNRFRLLGLLLLLLLPLMIVQAAPNCNVLIQQAKTLLNQAQTALQGNDLLSGQTYASAAAALLAPCEADSACVVIPQVNVALKQVATASSAADAAKLVGAAKTILELCEEAASATPRIMTPTPFVVPSETPIPGAFDFSAATTYTSPDKVVSIKLPKAGWIAVPAQQIGDYTFVYPNASDPSAIVYVTIDDAERVYTNLFGISARTTPASAKSDATAAPDRLLTASEALESLKATFVSDPGIKASAVRSARISGYDGLEMSISFVDRKIELVYRLAEIPKQPGKVVFTYLGARTSIWSLAKDTLQKMFDSLTVSPQLVPTLTPTATPQPLEMTATALINALTQTAQAKKPSPTPSASITSSSLNMTATALVGYLTQTAQAKTGTPAASTDYSKLPQTVTKDNSPVLGKADAPISLLLFEDFSCPHCREFSPIIDTVIDAYVRTGKARLETHLMTFVGGPLSETAALAALCTDPHNRFWDMRPMLYSLAEQEGPKAFTTERLTTLAKQFDLDISACLSTKQLLPTLKSDTQLFNALNLDGVPSLLYSTDGGKTWKQFVDDGEKQTAQPTIAIIQRTLDAVR